MNNFTYIMDKITDFFSSVLSPLKTQNLIRKLQTQKSSQKAEIDTLRADRDKYKRMYHVNRDLLADAIFERLSIDKHVTDVVFGNQTQNSIDGQEIETAVLVHCYVDSYEFDELKMHTASGHDHVDALISLYEDLKNSDIKEFTNADLNKNAETDEAE